jgi:hypothetical protein
MTQNTSVIRSYQLFISEIILFICQKQYFERFDTWIVCEKYQNSKYEVL